MSESVEMYLLKVAMLRQGARPVPLSLLAQELEVSSVSANEMCHRLMDAGWLTYEPYKGVTLTTKGEGVAQRVLRCRRLWEVFLAEKLNITPDIAEEVSCRLEHVTPDDVVDRLAAFLGNPTHSPQNEPIPLGKSIAAVEEGQSLATLSTGATGRIRAITADTITRDFLRAQGMLPGAQVQVLAVAADHSLLLELAGKLLSLAPSIAEQVQVTPLHRTAQAEQLST
jgi:DtxR family Mn-dependent transcriptional regulator